MTWNITAQQKTLRLAKRLEALVFSAYPVGFVCYFVLKCEYERQNSLLRGAGGGKRKTEMVNGKRVNLPKSSPSLRIASHCSFRGAPDGGGIGW